MLSKLRAVFVGVSLSPRYVRHIDSVDSVLASTKYRDPSPVNFIVEHLATHLNTDISFYVCSPYFDNFQLACLWSIFRQLGLLFTHIIYM